MKNTGDQLKKKKVEFQTVKIRKIEIKKLESYKLHSKQPYWELVKVAVDSLEAGK